MEFDVLRDIQPEGEQKEVLAIPPKGHTVVLGTAGSGKTTMALLRAIGLANMPSAPRVLLVTFNSALVQYMVNICEKRLPNLCIEYYHKFARGYLNSLGKMPKWNGILGNDEKESSIKKALEVIRAEYPDESTLKRPVSAFVDEITFIESFGLETEEQYFQVERIGRATMNIRRDNRQWFFMVYKKYLELRTKEFDWEDMALHVYKALQEDKRERLYQHIIVDEGQDFTPMMIKSLISAVGTGGSFSFFGDVSQQIYGSRLSWRDAGINVKDKIVRLHKNYRNPETIVLFANDITESQYWEKNIDTISSENMIAAGPEPVLIHFENPDKEFAWLIEQLKTLIRTSSCVIVCRKRSFIKVLEDALYNAGISSRIIDKNNAGFSQIKGVYLSTFHAIKGMEFENVFIPALDDDTFPDKEVVEKAAVVNKSLSDELKLLYVAVTRSQYGLYMSYSGTLSRLFPVESTHYKYVEGDEL